MKDLAIINGTFRQQDQIIATEVKNMKYDTAADLEKVGDPLIIHFIIAHTAFPLVVRRFASGFTNCGRRRCQERRSDT